MPSSNKSAGEAAPASSTAAGISQLATLLLVGVPSLANLVRRAAALVDACPGYLKVYAPLPGAERLEALFQLLAEHLDGMAGALQRLQAAATDAATSGAQHVRRRVSGGRVPAERGPALCAPTEL